MSDQNLANHARFVPGYHFLTAGLLLVNLLWSIIRLVRAPTIDSTVALLVAVALVMMFWYLRVFPLAVQDRVIRLEESLRIATLAPSLRDRVAEFTPHQLVALRFASDAELPGLAERVLSERITSRSAIKALIREWRADHQRA
jgi:hypothetical protein